MVIKCFNFYQKSNPIQRQHITYMQYLINVVLGQSSCALTAGEVAMLKRYSAVFSSMTYQ